MSKGSFKRNAALNKQRRATILNDNRDDQRDERRKMRKKLQALSLPDLMRLSRHLGVTR